MSPAYNYNWIIDRARSNEPVSIEINRPDFSKIIKFLTSPNIDGNGLVIQDDSGHGLIWIVKDN